MRRDLIYFLILIFLTSFASASIDSAPLQLRQIISSAGGNLTADTCGAGNFSIYNGSAFECGTPAGGAGGNPFDQSLNTTDNVTFNEVNITNVIRLPNDTLAFFGDGDQAAIYWDSAENQLFIDAAYNLDADGIRIPSQLEQSDFDISDDDVQNYYMFEQDAVITGTTERTLTNTVYGQVMEVRLPGNNVNQGRNFLNFVGAQILTQYSGTKSVTWTNNKPRLAGLQAVVWYNSLGTLNTTSSADPFLTALSGTVSLVKNPTLLTYLDLLLGVDATVVATGTKTNYYILDAVGENIRVDLAGISAPGDVIRLYGLKVADVDPGTTGATTWAAMFDGDVQVNTNYDYILEGTDTSKGDTRIGYDGAEVLIEVNGADSVNINETGIVDTPAGELWNHTETGYNISIAAANTHYDITNLAGGQLKGGTTASGSKLTIPRTGIYKVDYSISFAGTVANKIYHFSMDIDGSDVGKCHAARAIGTGLDVGNAGGTCLLSLTSGEAVGLMVEQLSAGAADIEVHSVNINIYQIG